MIGSVVVIVGIVSRVVERWTGVSGPLIGGAVPIVVVEVMWPVHALGRVGPEAPAA